MNAMIAIDLGTTHIKTVAFSLTGEIINSIENNTPIIYSESMSQIDPNELWVLVREQLNTVINREMNILGITLTGMAEAGLVINRMTQLAVTPIVPWFDKRTLTLAEEISSQEELRRFAYSGLRNSYKYGVYKFVWCLNKYKLDKENMIWLSVADYIAWMLTGEFFTDETLAARTYLFDILKREWNRETLNYYGLTQSNFPQVLKSGRNGKCLVEGVLKIKNSDKIMVSIGGHDHFCCSFGVLYNNEEAVCNSIGTAETFIGITKRDQFDDHSGLVYGPYVDNKIFYLGNVTSAGMAVEWFITEFWQNQLSYKEMNKCLAENYIEPSNILFFPFLSGIGTPEFSDTYKGAFLGLTRETTQVKLLQSVFEGISYQEKIVLQSVYDSEHLIPSYIYALGGGSKNPTWMQIKADILNHSIYVTELEQATCFGAVALHLYMNYNIDRVQQFIQLSRKEVKRFNPNKTFTDIYKDIYESSYKSYYQLIGKQATRRKK